MTEKVVAAPSALSPDALLKQAVTGGRSGDQAPPPARRAWARVASRHAAVAGAALALGLALGMGGTYAVASRADHASEALSQIQGHLDAGRTEATWLRGEVERMGSSLARLQDMAQDMAEDAKTRAAAVTDRATRAEQALAARIVASDERQDQSARDLTTRIAALSSQIEKRPMAPPAASAPPSPQAAKSQASEPAETGSIAETKSKPSGLDNWALREVYDGVAVVEDRKRRLVEVVPGNTLPGVGRIEAIERRGRAWVVVTRQGLITSQTW